MAKFNHELALTKDKLRRTWRLLGESIKAYPGLFILVLFTTTLDAVFASLLPKIAQLMIKDIGDKDTSFLWMHNYSWQGWLIVGVVIFILLILFEFATDYLSGIFGKRIEIYFRNKALARLVDQEMGFYFDNQIGVIMSRVIGDTEMVNGGVNDFLLSAVYFISMFITTMVIFFSIDTVIASISLAYFVVDLIVVWVTFVYLRRARMVAVTSKQSSDTDFTDRLMNIRLIKSNGTEKYEAKRTEEINKKYGDNINRVIWLQSTMNIFNVTFAVIFPVALIVIIILINNGNDPSEYNDQLIAFYFSSAQLGMTISVLPQVFRGFTKLTNATLRLNKIIEPVPSVQPNLKDGKKIQSVDSVMFKDVEFAYPDQPDNIVLQPFTMDFEKGKSYAIVGETGVGKSTIAKLLLRFYDPTKGQVLINGSNLKDLNLYDYLDHVGYVEQEPQILFGTVRENIKYGRFDATDEEMISAAKKAKIHKYIEKLPEGYDTILGERGFTFSGGQKQRIVIARLFLRNPELLILDEATSALDNIVEAQIQKELDKLMVGRTTVVIAHRLSTIKNVDEIIVLQRNKGIAQRGSFNQLVKTPGVFKALYEAGTL